MKIILGSSSQFRKQMLQEMGYDFEVVSPDINEKLIRDVNPEKLVLSLALAKAKAITNNIKYPATIITADQVISFDGTIREKPKDEQDARSFLLSYGIKPSKVINGIVVTNTLNNKQVTAIDIVEFYLEPLTKEVIDELIKQKIIFQCAGALRLEDPLMKPFIKEIRGTPDSFMGLSKKLTESLLKEVA
ncbi:MAG TPA: Maf family protein [Candidatus Sulfotelmatobacter sp.]|jgi:septum formation protein|nr:Maf family protein [Candidatus Sulfotelmatobacter sp.]